MSNNIGPNFNPGFSGGSSQPPPATTSPAPAPSVPTTPSLPSIASLQTNRPAWLASPGAGASAGTSPAPAVARGGRKFKGAGLTLNVSPTVVSGGVDMAKLRLVSNGSTHFHGSRSGSLITFHESTREDLRGSLLPMGALIDAGAAVFTGERGNSFDADGLNRNNLSVVDEHNVIEAINYAGDTSLARKSPVLSAASNSSNETPEVAAFHANARAAMDLLAASPDMLALVNEGFPVIYGLTPDQDNLQAASSAIKGEVGVPGGVTRENIKAIFVPADKVAVVQSLVGEAIHVAAISTFKS
ncbi:hypothetical protein ACFOLJ_02490 [Rugamonas sp. CCM 8940]|uniref:hypothetical protein n=1 Tax=Rugamonas sp. CCM 8940 TaxID=2765359 RepID=UPI0018F4BB30|nr:hypothetical protein [Rugamonas sp. CCM 8940]MBJ7311811.1 hypothetical protein [Rugamonas sp. CCM 8940]